MIVQNEKNTKLRGITLRVYKKTGQAINDYQMLESGDRILVAVSGGLDSLSLLKMLVLRRIRIPIDFEIIACCVDNGFKKKYLENLHGHIEKQGVECITQRLMVSQKDIDCFWCSWNRRKILFETARKTNCNKIALAHHLDDIIETIMLNLFAKGEISAMKPRLEMFGGKLTVIRPLSYLKKPEIKEFAAQFDFPENNYKCPNEGKSKRAVLKNAVNRLEKDFPYIKRNIFRALRQSRIKQDYLL